MSAPTPENPSAFDRSAGEATFERLDDPGPASQRRVFPRYGVDLDVSLGSDHNFYAGFVENMSVGGVFIATHVVKPVGERMELTIHLPDLAAPIRAAGEVRWVRQYSETSDLPPGMGVRFVEIDARSHASIEAFLAQREPLFFDE